MRKKERIFGGGIIGKILIKSFNNHSNDFHRGNK